MRIGIEKTKNVYHIDMNFAEAVVMNSIIDFVIMSADLFDETKEKANNFNMDIAKAIAKCKSDSEESNFLCCGNYRIIKTCDFSTMVELWAYLDMILWGSLGDDSIGQIASMVYKKHKYRNVTYDFVQYIVDCLNDDISWSIKNINKE